MTAILLAFDPAARAHYYGERALAGLRALGDVRLVEGRGALDEAALIEAARGCDVIVSDRQHAGTAALFAASPTLAVFMRCAVDIRNVDVEAAGRHGVLVTHASPGFGEAVAEWVFGAMIGVARHLGDSVHAWRCGAAPEPAMGRELRGATLGVVGHGHIGRRVADLGLAFGMRVVVADPDPQPASDGVAFVSLDDLLATADWVVCLAPATPHTENLFDRARFAQMKRDAVFVNASRGNLVDETALRDALDSGRLAACALDVGRAPDQMPSPALARHPRVLATPHIGGLTRPAVEHQALETVAQLDALRRGEMPAGAVNPLQARRLDRLRRA